MSRATLLLVDPSPAVRHQLVSVLAAVPKTHLETCTRERIAAESERLRPRIWLLADPVRALAADGAAAMVPERTASLSLDASQDALLAALRAGAAQHFALPAQAQALAQWLRALVKSVPAPEGQANPPLIAESPAMQRLLQLIERIAGSTATVFLTGESGVGKEVLAREIHRRSPRRARPFEAINCAAVPENMLEAVLFGHERGAFTGASEARPGKFRAADGGTLLLDEITEMPLPLQAKLLRVLQEREVEPLGARRPKSVDVRVLATSNRCPQSALAEGLLREDLFYRLNVFPLHLPPLRERAEDLLPLAQSFAQELSCGRITGLTADAVERLQAHDWPGNVRELRNLMERSCVLAQGGELDAADVMFDADWLFADGDQAQRPTVVENPSLHLGSQLQQQEIRVILDTLAAAGGDRKQTATRLGISPRTLRYKLARLRDEGVAIPAP
ncbi:sigma-54 interaction domain-containing protein [Thiorhodovibrio frisius]|uniref:Sigma-54 interacting regulator n=1 Tax=Thiorhodovibrio frisius TaxID=631362 RepID=H8YZ35_9GAMM|nr:sigma-54-dependent Fis family transcriptional regulator [Thiorhodovibrio frisius]EIC21962.1 sigma-54 interacting regulator [Thiorhodovibrio frisius]WPL24251.1 Regulatory protein LuxO [Thiorhodovibrio frisius]